MTPIHRVLSLQATEKFVMMKLHWAGSKQSMPDCCNCVGLESGWPKCGDCSCYFFMQEQAQSNCLSSWKASANAPCWISIGYRFRSSTPNVSVILDVCHRSGWNENSRTCIPCLKWTRFLNLSTLVTAEWCLVLVAC